MSALCNVDEEFYLKIHVSDALVISLSTAEDEFNDSKKTLFATFVWTGATLLAKELVSMAALIQGASVLEFGAAAGLPSIVCSKLGADLVCASDYPSKAVIAALQRNLHHNQVDAQVVEHIWGEPADALLAANQGKRYDLILAAECLWRHDCHQTLVASITACLKDTGKVVLTYSHHIPGMEDEDDRFFSLCAEQGLQVSRRTVLQGKHMWSEKIVDVFLCVLEYRR